MIDQEQHKLSAEQTDRLLHNNPVTVTASESVGIIAMSIIAFTLLISLLRAQARIRELQEREN